MEIDENNKTLREELNLVEEVRLVASLREASLKKK